MKNMLKKNPSTKRTFDDMMGPGELPHDEAVDKYHKEVAPPKKGEAAPPPAQPSPPPLPADDAEKDEQPPPEQVDDAVNTTTPIFDVLGHVGASEVLASLGARSASMLSRVARATRNFVRRNAERLPMWPAKLEGRRQAVAADAGDDVVATNMTCLEAGERVQSSFTYNHNDGFRCSASLRRAKSREGSLLSAAGIKHEHVLDVTTIASDFRVYRRRLNLQRIVYDPSTHVPGSPVPWEDPHSYWVYKWFDANNRHIYTGYFCGNKLHRLYCCSSGKFFIRIAKADFDIKTASLRRELVAVFDSQYEALGFEARELESIPAADRDGMDNRDFGKNHDLALQWLLQAQEQREDAVQSVLVMAMTLKEMRGVEIKDVVKRPTDPAHATIITKEDIEEMLSRGKLMNRTLTQLEGAVGNVGLALILILGRYRRRSLSEMQVSLLREWGIITDSTEGECGELSQKQEWNLHSEMVKCISNYSNSFARLVTVPVDDMSAQMKRFHKAPTVKFVSDEAVQNRFSARARSGAMRGLLERAHALGSPLRGLFGSTDQLQDYDKHCDRDISDADLRTRRDVRRFMPNISGYNSQPYLHTIVCQLVVESLLLPPPPVQDDDKAGRPRRTGAASAAGGEVPPGELPKLSNDDLLRLSEFIVYSLERREKEALRHSRPSSSGTA